MIRLALTTLLTVATTLSAFAGATFKATGIIDMIPSSMSDDASIVVGAGIYGVPNLYYTEAGGATVIGDGCASGGAGGGTDHSGLRVLTDHLAEDGADHRAANHLLGVVAGARVADLVDIHVLDARVYGIGLPVPG